MRGVEIIAHRGASGHAPEHTVPAYDLALAQGAHMLELDVRPVPGRGLVVQHDRVEARRPLALEDVLRRYGARTRLLIELKDPDPSWEGDVLAAVARHGLEERVVLQSFDAHALRRLRERAPHLAYAPLVRAAARPSRLDALATWASAVGVWHHRVDARLVARAHDRGLAVRAWTVNAPRAIERLLALGVDGVITDLPDVAGAVALPAAAPLQAA